jgi:hypothetical protein
VPEADLALPVLVDEAPAEATAAAAPRVVKIDDPQVEEMTHHRIKMGRYRRDVHSSIRSDLWWCTVEMADRALQPLTHAMRHFQAKRPDVHNGTSGCRLTCGDGLRILSEFERPFVDLAWAAELALSDAFCSDEVSRLLGLQVELSLHCAAAFDRRIVRTTQETGPQFLSFACGCCADLRE